MPLNWELIEERTSARRIVTWRGQADAHDWDAMAVAAGEFWSKVWATFADADAAIAPWSVIRFNVVLECGLFIAVAAAPPFDRDITQREVILVLRGVEGAFYDIPFPADEADQSLESDAAFSVLYNELMTRVVDLLRASLADARIEPAYAVLQSANPFTIVVTDHWEAKTAVVL